MFVRICLFLAMISALFTMCGCATSSGAYTVGTAARVTYSPNIIPVQISYIYPPGTIQVSFDKQIKTPIGTFAVGVDISGGLANRRYLILRFKGRETHYLLEEGKRYRISIPNDENGGTTVETTGDTGNVIVNVPNPTSETVAQLRHKLNTSQEALLAAQAKLRTRYENEQVSPPEENQEEMVEDAPSTEIDQIEEGTCVCEPCECEDCTCDKGDKSNLDGEPSAIEVELNDEE